MMNGVERLIETAKTLHEEATPIGTLKPEHITEYSVSAKLLGCLGDCLVDLQGQAL